MGTTVLFGGTFDPLHIGHYKMLKTLDELPEVDRVFLLPDRIPPHKKQSFAVADEVRIEMCRRAIEGLKKTQLCLIEFERQGKSYTFDTVTALQEQYPDEDFWFACGGDMLNTLDTWYRAEELLKLCGFYAFERLGVAGFEETAQRLRNMGAKIRLLDVDIPKVSSTQLRESLRRGVYDERLPKSIREYLAQNKVYEEGAGK